MKYLYNCTIKSLPSAYATNVDADDYTTPGFYHVGISTNSPYGDLIFYGILLVFTGYSGHAQQIAISANNHHLYYRGRNTSSNAWSDWDEAALKSSVDTLNENAYKFKGILDSSKDLNNVTETGFYTVTTKPTNSIGSYCQLIVTRQSVGGAVYQTMIGDSNIYTRAYTGNPLAWSAWVKQPTRAEVDKLNTDRNAGFLVPRADAQITGSILDKAKELGNNTANHGFHWFYTQNATDSPNGTNVSYALINVAAQNFIYIYVFSNASIWFAICSQSTTSLSWTQFPTRTEVNTLDTNLENLGSKLTKVESYVGTSFDDAFNDGTAERLMLLYITGTSETAAAPDTANRWIGMQYVNGTREYGMQVAFSFGYDRIYIRRRSNSTTSTNWVAIS